MRTIVELPDAQIKALVRLCQKEGILRAEAIRRAVDNCLSGKPTRLFLRPCRGCGRMALFPGLNSAAPAGAGNRVFRIGSKLVATHEGNESQKALQAGFGLWRGRKLDGRSYVESIRAEWENQNGGK